jgi:hypothetical protein
MYFLPPSKELSRVADLDSSGGHPAGRSAAASCPAEEGVGDPGVPAGRRPPAKPFPSGLLLLFFFTINTSWSAPVELSRQVIDLPADAERPLFTDIDGDGRSDLLVMDPAQKQLWHYHQRSTGFSNAPDQIVSLPPQTAWAAACDVDAHPGRELLFSTARGAVYSRQNSGRFKSEQRTLIETRQIFTNFDAPILIRLNTNSASQDGTNDFIPVISAGQTVLYHRNSAYQWSPDAPLALDVKKTTWQINDSWSQWTVGPNRGRSLRVWQSFQPKADLKPDEEPPNAAMRKIYADFNQDAVGYSNTDRVDVNGDGRMDLVLWHVAGRLDCKTDVYVFLRGADQKLPERPTQILHCRGFPIPAGSTSIASSVVDLTGDGIVELVLLELKSTFTSVSGAVETALSRSLDWALTIRSFRQGAFSRSADASFPVKGILPAGKLDEWPIFILGDFNGDGRPDLLFRRSETHWNIFCSTKDARWFVPEPAMAFDTPANGYAKINDVNGDGLSDIIWHETDEPRLSIFRSPSKGKNP